MNVLTGAVVSALLLGLLGAWAADGDGDDFQFFAGITAVMLIAAVFLAGHWTALLLAKV